MQGAAARARVKRALSFASVSPRYLVFGRQNGRGDFFYFLSFFGPQKMSHFTDTYGQLRGVDSCQSVTVVFVEVSQTWHSAPIYLTYQRRSIYLERSSEDRTHTKFARHSFASTCATRLLPQPLGPYSSAPAGAEIPILANASGCCHGHCTSRWSRRLDLENPPTEAHVGPPPLPPSFAPTEEDATSIPFSDRGTVTATAPTTSCHVITKFSFGREWLFFEAGVRLARPGIVVARGGDVGREDDDLFLGVSCTSMTLASRLLLLLLLRNAARARAVRTRRSRSPPNMPGVNELNRLAHSPRISRSCCCLLLCLAAAFAST